jgi:hypothetical protein
MGPVSDVPDSVAAEAVLDEAATAGFHCIKIYGGMQGPSYRALVDGGRRRGIRTVGHIPRELGWRDMLTARPDAVAHAEEDLSSPIESQADIDSIVAGMTRQGIGLVTTLTNYDLIGRQLVELPHLLRDADLATYSPVHRRTWEAGRNRYLRIFRPEQLMTLRRLLGFQRALVRQLDSAGTRLLLGTDTGNNFVLPGRSVHDELEQLVLAGLRTAAALRAATVNPAAFLGQTGLWGVVAEGARADLVLLGGNPLTDISNTRLVLGVMNRGTWYVRAELDRWEEELRQSYEAEARMVELLERDGPVAAIEFVTAESRRLGRPAVGVFAFNEVGYQFWRLDNDPASARMFFEANRRLYPDDPMPRAALAELEAAVRRTP